MNQQEMNRKGNYLMLIRYVGVKCQVYAPTFYRSEIIHEQKVHTVYIVCMYRLTFNRLNTVCMFIL